MKTLFIFKYTRQWGTGIVGIIADSVSEAIFFYSTKQYSSSTALSPTEVIAEKELPAEENEILFAEFIDNPEYEG